MAEQEWMRFEVTGRVDDYLAYSRGRSVEMLIPAGGSNAKESEQKDGADHCAYRYGVSGDTHRGL